MPFWLKQTIFITHSKFYKELYTSTCNSKEEDIKLFLENVKLPKLIDDQSEALESPITCDEILRVIKMCQMTRPQNWTVSPQNSFNVRLLKMILLLHSMYMEAFERGEPIVAKELIILILKKNKDTYECKSYSPISLVS